MEGKIDVINGLVVSQFEFTLLPKREGPGEGMAFVRPGNRTPSQPPPKRGGVFRLTHDQRIGGIE